MARAGSSQGQHEGKVAAAARFKQDQGFIEFRFVFILRTAGSRMQRGGNRRLGGHAEGYPSASCILEPDEAGIMHYLQDQVGGVKSRQRGSRIMGRNRIGLAHPRDAPLTSG